jgi:hypothetical protein
MWIESRLKSLNIQWIAKVIRGASYDNVAAAERNYFVLK